MNKNFPYVLEHQCLDFLLLSCLLKTAIGSLEFHFLELGCDSESNHTEPRVGNDGLWQLWQAGKWGMHTNADSTWKLGVGRHPAPMYHTHSVLHMSSLLARTSDGFLYFRLHRKLARVPTYTANLTCQVRMGTTYYRISSTWIPVPRVQYFSLV